MALPKRFRSQISKAVLTRGLDGCLFLYPTDEWDKLASKIKDLPLTAISGRDFSRYLFSGASEIEFDSLGRFVIPDHLQRYAHLNKEVVVIGVLNRVEIWSKEIWEKLSKKIDKDSEEIAEKLSDTGV